MTHICVYTLGQGDEERFVNDLHTQFVTSEGDLQMMTNMFTCDKLFTF